MHPIRKQRLYFIGALMLALVAAVALALYALKQNINLFYTPSQLQQTRPGLTQTIRVGGLVKAGSVVHSRQDNGVHFVVTDTQHNIEVYYRGLLPDLFREGQGIVVEGKLDGQGVLQASEVLAKHDENYMPPQVAESLPAATLKAMRAGQ